MSKPTQAQMRMFWHLANSDMRGSEKEIKRTAIQICKEFNL
jgi:hypothetical protein